MNKNLRRWKRVLNDEAKEKLKDNKDRKLGGYYNIKRFPVGFNDRWFTYERVRVFLAIFQTILNNHRLFKPIPVELQKEYASQ